MEKPDCLSTVCLMASSHTDSQAHQFSQKIGAQGSGALQQERSGIEQRPVLFRGIQVIVGGAVDYISIRVKPGAMAWTIPALFRGVPGNDASEMRTYC